jgi:hypothetical protein
MRGVRTTLSIVLALGLVGAAVGAPASASVTRDDATPERVVLTPAGNAATSQSFTWRTGADVLDGWVQFREVGTTEWREVTAILNEELQTGPVATRTHSATATALTSATEYEYTVGNAESRSEVYRFTTAGDSDDAFSFLYFGDAQNDLAASWTPVVEQAFERFPDVVGSVHAGDLINNSDRDSEWDEWFGAMDGYTQTTNVIAAPGNHEYSGDRYLRLWKSNFEYPTNGPKAGVVSGDSDAALQEAAYREHIASVIEETAYLVDYQGVRFIMLNASRSQAGSLIRPTSLPPCLIGCPDPTQLWLQMQADWIEEAVETNPGQWSVAVFHQPVFSTATGRDEQDLRDAWLPVFQRTNIDLVLMGHDHTYARGFVNADATDLDGVTTGPVYAVAVSGPKYYDMQPADDNVWTRNGATQVVTAGYTSTFQGITVDGGTLRYESVVAATWGDRSTSDVPIGGTLDSFTITKFDDGTKVVTEDGVAIPGKGEVGPGTGPQEPEPVDEEPAGEPQPVALGHRVIGSVPMGASSIAQPGASDFDERAGILYVADQSPAGTGRIEAIDVSDGTVVGSFDVGAPVIDMSYVSSLPGLVVAFGSGETTAANGFSTEPGALGEPLLDDPIVMPAPIVGVGIDDGTAIAYFALSAGAIVAVDVDAGELVGQYPVGAGIGRLKVDPATGNLYILTPGSEGSTLRILGGRSGMGELRSFDLAGDATSLDIDSAAGLVYVGHDNATGGMSVVEVVAGTVTRIADPTFGTQLESVSVDGEFGLIYSTSSTGGADSVTTIGRDQAPRIIVSPTAASITAGATTTLSAQAWGVPTPAVQWQVRTSAEGGWVDVIGATTDAVTVSGSIATAQYRAVYSAVIGDEVLSTATATATVTTTEPAAAPPATVPTDENRGSGMSASVVDGKIVVSVGQALAGTWVGATLHSEPAFLGWRAVSTIGSITVPVPDGAIGVHRVVIQDATGAVLGWVLVDLGTPAAAASALPGTGSAAPIEIAIGALLLLVTGAALTARRRMTVA